MAFPGARVELQLAGVWTDVTSDVYTRNEIGITRGRGDEAARTDPGKCSLTFNNRTGKFSPRNPVGPYYGLIGRNTPVRVSVPGPVTYLRLDGGRARTPTSAALNVTDLDVRIDVASDLWNYPGQAVILASRWDSAIAFSWRFMLTGGNIPLLTWTEDGTGATRKDVFASTPLAVDADGRMCLRATLDVNNGAGGRTVTFYSAPTMAGPWTVLGVPDVAAGTTAVANVAVAMEVGNLGTPAVGSMPLQGRVYAAEVRNGIGGTVVAAPNFAAAAEGDTSLVDTAGRTWSLLGAATLTNRLNRFHGEISSWPVRWDVDGRDVWTAAEASGILRRLGQGARPLDSTLRRRIPTLNPQAYWPLEEGSDATQAASPLTGVAPMTTRGFNWAAVDTLPSSAPLPTIPSTDTQVEFLGPVPQPSPAPTAWNVQCLYRLDTVNASLATLLRIPTTGTVAEWRLQQAGTVSAVVGFDGRGNEIHRQNIGTGTNLYKQWTRLEFFVEQVGGNVKWTIVWTNVGGTAGFSSGTLAGTIGYPAAVASPVGGYDPAMNGLALGHLSVWHFGFGQGNPYEGAIDSWAGETAAVRMYRLTTEEAVPLSVYGHPDTSQAVGTQSRAELLELLGECGDADGGILGEQRNSLALVYRTRETLYNQVAALTLRYDTGREVAPPLEPVDDDQRTRNDVSVTRKNGSSTRAIRTDGRLSVNPPPAGMGVYPEGVTLNLARDDQTANQAGWRLHLGTWDEARYPTVHVQLHAAPHLIAAATAVDIGDRIVITNPPPWLPPGDIDLIVQGYTETIGPTTWDLVFTCTPGGPWRVGAVDDPVRGRADTAGSALAAAATASATTLSVATTAGPLWVRAAPELNANPRFEADLAGWSAVGSVIARVPGASPAGGAWACRMTPDGVAQFPRVESILLPAAAGLQYTVSGWLKCATARTLNLDVNWFDSGFGYLNTSATTVAVAADTWTWVEGTVTAPTGTVYSDIAATVGGFPPSTDVLTCDQVTLRAAVAGASPRDFPFDVLVGGEIATVTAVSGTTSPQTMTVIRAVNGITKSQAAGSDVRLAVPTIVAL